MKPTPYPEVNEQLERILSGAQIILGKRFVGMYLYGSLASGDFDPESSDIDFLVAVTEDLNEPTVKALKAFHDDLKATGGRWSAHLEGCYMSVGKLRKYTPQQSVPHLSEGSFETRQLGADWVFQRAIIRNQGVAIAGPLSKTLIDPVSKEDIKAAVRDVLVNSWPKSIENANWLKPKKYQAFTVLTMCRALYALEFGEIISKPQAASWARGRFCQWQSLIDRALAERSSEKEGDYVQVLQFVRFAISRVEPAHAT